MQWAYGITTVPSRFHDPLPRTLKSLAEAGFDAPWIFVDGGSEVPPPLSKYRITYRTPKVGIFGSWILALWELYLRNPDVDRYAIFQDDFVTYKNLRQYLEQCNYPDRGYWNLYTFPENERKLEGWYLSNQKGKGAVALVFDRLTVRKLLGHQHMPDRVQDVARRNQFVDGAVVDCLRKQNYREYVHNPSLVQHTGIVSTVGHKYGSDASTFRGEDFDALDLSPKKPPVVHTETSKRLKIGLVGYNCNTGLGELNRQIATYVDVDRWLVKPHAKHKTNPPHDDVDTWICPTGVKVDKFVRSVDVVLFCETHYYNQLHAACQRLNKRMVCVPMQEWMPPGAKGWPQQVDLFICPNQYCYDLFSHVMPCIKFDWPVDTKRFQYKVRDKVKQFLYLHGHGGVQNRKGGPVIKELLRLWPDAPVVVRSQAKEDWPAGTKFLPESPSNADVYSDADVLICPHTVDGLGLEPLEAMSCGMPTIVTDGRPWDEAPALVRIRSTVTQSTFRRPVQVFTPDANHLLEICKEWINKPIESEALAVREWAEKRSWDVLADRFTETVRYGKAERTR